MATGGQAAARPRVVVGGGFAGIGAARKRRKVDVVLVDKHDYRTLQPLLCQVPTDLLPSLSVGHTLRDLFHEQPNAQWGRRGLREGDGRGDDGRDSATSARSGSA